MVQTNLKLHVQVASATHHETLPQASVSGQLILCSASWDQWCFSGEDEGSPQGSADNFQIAFVLPQELVLCSLLTHVAVPSSVIRDQLKKQF